MRSAIILLLLLALLVLPGSAQERYLVSPDREVIPLSPGESAGAVIAAKARQRALAAVTCGDKFTFGYPPGLYTLNTSFGARHRDVLGQWFVAQSAGTIDSIFWDVRGEIGAYDSTVYLRVHASVIGPHYGPGVRPGPFAPPCQNWGYWVNTNDLDQGIAAFREEATDTNWVSTINDSAEPSLPPVGAELWGLGGYPVKLHPYRIGAVAMADLSAPIPVAIGDRFFISLRVAHAEDSVGGHRDPVTEEARTTIGASGFAVGTNDPDYPSRNWKFYEHDKGPSNCSGVPLDSLRKGWIARGGFGSDSLSVAAFNFWYVMTVVTNTPPIFFDTSWVEICLLPGPLPVRFGIEDCDIATPGLAGVDSAFLEYSIDELRQPDLPLANMFGSAWGAEIAVPAWPAAIRYRARAVDRAGAFGYTRYFDVVSMGLGNYWYAVDTSSNGPALDIRASGTAIPPEAFFGPRIPPPGFDPLDNGTAGPFPLRGPFALIGDTLRYAWIGVDGAVALSRTPQDTLDVNAGGAFGSSWTFPSPAVGWRGDPGAWMPKSLLAPFYHDFTLVAPGGGAGAIRVGDGGDSCLFIVEWDSVRSAGGAPGETCTFRVVLDRCAGTIEYQYGTVHPEAIAGSSLIGAQNAPSYEPPPFTCVLLNRNGGPVETVPHDGFSILVTPRAVTGVRDPTALPSAFVLRQNYPNPFNPATTIEYDLAERSNVRLRVFSVSGELVASLVDGVQDRGTHAVRFDAGHLASGVYLCRLEAGNFLQERKLVLMK
jgi:hypothetical protein